MAAVGRLERDRLAALAEVVAGGVAAPQQSLAVLQDAHLPEDGAGLLEDLTEGTDPHAVGV
jgi:hypothetical protein